MKTYSIFASLLYTLSGIKLIIFSFGCNELVVISALDDTALFEYDDTITVSDGGQAVCNDKGRSSGHQFIHTILYDTLSTGIDGAGCLIENQNRWICDCCAGNGNHLALSLA